jgi:RND superfamily putative drug exporter
MSTHPTPSSTGTAFARWASYSVRHRGRVLIGWALLLAVLAPIALTFGSGYNDTFTLPGTDAQQAFDVLEERFPSQAGDSATLVIKTDAGIDDPAVRRQVTELVAQAGAIPEVAGVVSPYDDSTAISADRKIAYATVAFDKAADDLDLADMKALLALGDESTARGFQVEVGGRIAGQAESASGSATSELIGIGAAVVILLVAFGSIIAMGLPIVSAFAGLAAGFLGIMLATRFFDIASFTATFAIMIGLGVGIDYALFVVTRYREGLRSGMSVEEAVVRAIDTAGRAVAFAGTVVAIALLGLFLVGIPLVAAIGLASAIVVFFNVLVALTLLPALLAYIGHRVDRWSVPGLHVADPAKTDTIWYRWSLVIQRRPWPFLAASALILLLLAAPIFGLRLGSSDDGNLPESQHARRAFDLLEEGFGPGFNGPLVLAIENDGVVDTAQLQGLIDALGRDAGVAAVSPAMMNPAGDAAVISVIPTTSQQDSKTTDLVKRLRTSVIPNSVAGSDLNVYVGGTTAATIDITSKITNNIPIFFGIVIGLSMLLLMAVFRSVAVPIKAALMNLLSICATYGVLVAVFQWGWGASLFGISKTGPIDAFLPMMLFAILFGLSMDYEVFLLSRMREEYVRTHRNAESVAHGLAVTARVIAAAAAIMVLVFGSFIFTEDRIVKQFGLGLAVAILVDGTLVRLVLVPATMELLGDWNWWFPRWLDRITPKLNVEGAVAPEEVAPAD